MKITHEDLNLYRLIAEHMTDMMRIIDVNGRTIYASPSHEEILGYTPEQYIEHQIFYQILDSEDLPILDAVFQDMVETKQPRSLEFSVTDIQGQKRILEEHGSPVLGIDGRVEYVVIVSRDITEKKNDITERKKAEAALIESEERYRRLVEMSPEAIVLHSDYKFIYVNPAGLKLYGASDLDELVGKSLLDMVHPTFKEEAALRLSWVYEHQTVTSIVEQKAVRLNQEAIDVEVVIASIPYKGLNAGITLIRDITDRKHVEEDRLRMLEFIRESEERYFRLQTSLDRFSHDMFGVMNIAEMERRLVKEIEDCINTTEVSLIEVSNNNEMIMKAASCIDPGWSQLIIHVDMKKIPLCEIIERPTGYFLKIAELRGKSQLICIGRTSFLDVTANKVWLKTLTRYANVLYDNFRFIEDLTQDLKEIATRQMAPPWLLRVLFSLSENERKQLSQDLHDSALQEQIIWYRKLDHMATDRSVPQEIRMELQQISQGLLDVIYQIRITCNELRPPLLKEAGIVASLEALFELTQLRADYAIEFDYSQFRHTLNDDQLIGLYRVVQELLANAAKHSKATHVSIMLFSRVNRIQLSYEDNGIGFDVSTMEAGNNSMGVFGIKERIRSMHGKIEFYSKQNKGLAINISIPAINADRLS